MKRKGNQGLPIVHRISRAANEDFIAPEQGRDGVVPAHSGWDPYEVWRTRVKEPIDPETGCESDPLH